MGAKNIKSSIIKNLVSLILILSITSPAMAHYPCPVPGTATVDGLYLGEWNLNDDFFAYMYEAGNPDKNVLCELYLRYDCTTQMLYALVLACDSVELIFGEEEQWIKIDGVSPSGIVLDGEIGENFQYVEDNSGCIIGWEGSANIAPGTYTLDSSSAFIAHALTTEDETASTGEINLILKCTSVPEFPSIVVPVIMVLGMMFIFQRRKEWN